LRRKNQNEKDTKRPPSSTSARSKRKNRTTQQSQQRLAEKLHVKQAEVSKIEHRTDMYVSTLRDFIQAMGGTLEITASFPNRPPVRITQFELLEADARKTVEA
jgi:transcriptional regulator with XRE-family HTH domain